MLIDFFIESQLKGLNYLLQDLKYINILELYMYTYMI